MKTEGSIKNGQSRDTGNTGYTRNGTKTKQNKKHNITQKNGSEPRCWRKVKST